MPAIVEKVMERGDLNLIILKYHLLHKTLMYFRSMAIFHSFCVLSHPVFYILFSSFNFAATSNVVITPYYVVTTALQPHSNLKITVFIILECPSKCEFIVNIICYKNSHQCCGCVCKWNSYFIITSLPKGITCVQVNNVQCTTHIRDMNNVYTWYIFM